jgi:GMP synthase (glutamine-hydrolysing)
VRPFLLLSSRAEDQATHEEYRAFLRCTGLAEHELRPIRMEAGPLPEFRLDDYTGIFVGGSPFNTSDPEPTKSAVQQRVERELRALLDDVVVRDFPFFGACYGVGTLGVHQGGVIDRTYAEPIGPVRIDLTDAGAADPVLAGMATEFEAFVGHKEAVHALPRNAVLLATSASCPVQMFRVRTNLYATQFHPELDLPGLITRVRVYQNAGYFPPEELDALVARLAPAVVTEPGRMLANFVARYA